MRHVHQQPGIDVDLDALAVLGHGRPVAQRPVLAVPAGAEAGLVAVGGDHLARGADVHLAGLGVDDDGVALVDALHDAAGVADGGDAQRLGDDGDMALAAGVLQHQAAQPRAVVVEEVGRAHGAGDQHGVVRQLVRRGVGAGAAGENAQQAVG